MKILYEQHSNETYIYHTYIYCSKHSLIGRIVVPKEDALFKTRPKPKVSVQLRWISLFPKSSWIKTTASGLSYELVVNGEEKINENWDIIYKRGHSTFHFGKPGNFKNSRDVI